MNDTRAVQIGSVAASMYALVADGHNGFRVVQLISPDTVEGASGFSPRPAPRLISTYHTHHPALAVSRGLDRDRVVDETGGQTVVFGRRGSRPFKLNEMKPFLRHSNGSFYKVEDIALKTVEEEIDVRGTKRKITRQGVFTKSGRELLPPDPPRLPDAEPFQVPVNDGLLQPEMDLLNLPFGLPSENQKPPVQEKKTPPAAN